MNRPLRILVAEDEPGDAMLIQRAFTNSGQDISVNFVTNGQEAIDFLRRKGPYSGHSSQPLPTLLLLDLRMPEVDGFDVLRWLRRHPRLRNILVIAFSSSEDAEDMRLAYELGADVYVVKPQDPDLFMDTVHDMERHWLRLNATPECGTLTH